MWAEDVPEQKHTQSWRPHHEPRCLLDVLGRNREEQDGHQSEQQEWEREDRRRAALSHEELEIRSERRLGAAARLYARPGRRTRRQVLLFCWPSENKQLHGDWSQGGGGWLYCGQICSKQEVLLLCIQEVKLQGGASAASSFPWSVQKWFRLNVGGLKRNNQVTLGSSCDLHVNGSRLNLQTVLILMAACSRAPTAVHEHAQK